jgi:protein gp37
MNKTKIDWADRSWNPVTGCLHNCEYCYARKIANRFADKSNLTYVDGVKPEHLSNIPYPYGFVPTLHKERLIEPLKIKKPQTIFVCSMADLFGEWVPDEWIKEVFEACDKAPQHRYLFLTKNPERYIGTKPKDNYWYGSTITDGTQKALIEISGKLNTFVSIEPLMGDVSKLRDLRHFKWVIIGAETGNRKDKVIPKKEWIESIVETCKYREIPVFMKESLRELMGNEFIQEYPWELNSK